MTFKGFQVTGAVVHGYVDSYDSMRLTHRKYLHTKYKIVLVVVGD